LRLVQLIFILALLVFSVMPYCLAGPYPPPPGEPGSTAVYMTDENIVSWADEVVDFTAGVEADPNYSSDKALGPAFGGSYDVVCLGRGGEITLSFSCGIGDKVGYDFLVFENAVTDRFLELGWVEVSSDGNNFFRFRNHSLTPDKLGPFGGLDTTDISGFAGKYRHSYGTPFDLQELRDASPLLDVDNVYYVRIVDVVGDGNSLDTNGNQIYDPYPTIGTAGFDLDAVGVINTISSDLDEDGKVDGNDLLIFTQAWLSLEGDGNWDGRCDLGWPRDGAINYRDYMLVADKWRYGVNIE
jgi:hypothetical protein